MGMSTEAGMLLQAHLHLAVPTAHCKGTPELQGWAAVGPAQVIRGLLRG